MYACICVYMYVHKYLHTYGCMYVYTGKYFNKIGYGLTVAPPTQDVLLSIADQKANHAEIWRVVPK